MSNLSPIEALKRIEQFSDSGDYATAIVKMKAIATEALAYKGQDDGIPTEAIKFLRATHIIWKQVWEKELIEKALKMAYDEGHSYKGGEDSSGKETGMKKWMDDRAKELTDKVFLYKKTEKEELYKLICNEFFNIHFATQRQSVPPYKEEEKGYKVVYEEIPLSALDGEHIVATFHYHKDITIFLRAIQIPANQPYKEEVDKEEKIVKFILGIKSNYPPIDTPCLRLYDQVYAENRHISFAHAQEQAVRACVKYFLESKQEAGVIIPDNEQT